MYQYVSFSNEPYSFAYKTGKKQYKMLEELSKIENIEERLLKNYEKLSFSEKWILSKLRNLSDFVNK
jgi:hypothetical protein